ncbi:MAG: zinc ribbon domain-containing protein, partial [Desulfobacterales bacterium]|nr:zinc ribbon domain-containing protein [Desulfobacterales bacterium]
PAMFAQYFAGAKAGDQPAQETSPCPECQSLMPVTAKFCPQCGHQQVVFTQCGSCGKNLTPNAKFCSRCGHLAEEKPKPKSCSKCSGENLSDSQFCNQCGEKL